MKTLTTKTTSIEFPRKYLEVLNGTLSLTDKEIELTAAIIDKYIKYGSQGLREPFLSKFVFSTEERKSLCDSLDGLSSQNLGNKFKRLLEKKVLLNDEAGYKLNPSLLPVQEIKFKFIIDDSTREVIRHNSEEEGTEETSDN